MPAAPPPALEAFPARAHDKLRYADTDRQGHVNNAVFATFLETGRVELLYDPAAPLAGPGASFVIASLRLDLRAELTWPGRVEIGTGVLKIGTSSLTLAQALYQGATCAATGETVIVQVGPDGRPLPLSVTAVERLSTLLLPG